MCLSEKWQCDRVWMESQLSRNKHFPQLMLFLCSAPLTHLLVPLLVHKTLHNWTTIDSRTTNTSREMRHPTHLFELGFNRLGFQIGKHPKAIICAGIALAVLSSVGLLRFREENNVRTEYSPMNGPSKTEYRVAKEFLKQNGTLDPCYVMSRALDGGSLLRDQYRWLLYNLTKSLQQEIRVHKNGRQYAYRDLCEPYCEMNTAFLAFLKLYDPKQPLTHTYPAMELFGTKAFIGNNVYGVTLKDVSNADDAGADADGRDTPTEEERALLMAISDRQSAEGRQPPPVKLLDSFTTAVMPFFLVADYGDNELLAQWQNAAIELFERPQYANLLKTGMTSDHLVTQEVRRMGIETAPLLVGSVVAMLVFVLCTLIRVRREENRLWEAFVGCLVPLLAMSSAIGVMSIAGWCFQSIIVAALFLVLSVGVDDIFILMRAWHRSTDAIEEGGIAQRMAKCLEDAGPSITISSLTNVISFAIGAFSDTPAVRTFCIFSAIAISICWLYQLVFLSAVLVFGERRRTASRKTVLSGPGPDPNGAKVCAFAARMERLHGTVVEFWALAVTKWSTRSLLALFMCVYFGISWLGIQRLQSNISIDKMALPNSYLHQFQMQFETALRNMQPISVFVLRPGDLRDPQQLARVKQLVWDFEHALNSYGPESTFFWLPQYEDFVRFHANGDDQDLETDPAEERVPPFSYTEIPAFFKSASYFYLSSFVHHNEEECVRNSPGCIESFFFVTNFHDVIKYHELVPTVREWRRIAAHYADMGVYAYSDHTPFVDQTMSIDQTVLGSVACALVCTCLVCLVFIPHFLSVVAAVFSVFSISWGIFGFLSLWGVDLDPLSMASLLMAIGFSVDFTAHISYHYYKAPSGSPRIRMQQALSVIGWPMVQVGLSTIVALLPLLFKQSYLAMVFLKTIIVVVLLGMFHGLVILPAVLTALPSPDSFAPSAEKQPCRRISARSIKSSSSSSGCSSNGTGEMGSSTASSSLEDCGSDRGSAKRVCSENSGKEGTEERGKLAGNFFKNQHLLRGGIGGDRQKSLKEGTEKRETGHNVEEKERRRRRSTSFGCRFTQAVRQRLPQRRISVADLLMVDGTPTPGVALVHRIPLGRSASNAF